MLVLKAICDALTHWLTVQKAFISAHPPPPPQKKKKKKKFRASGKKYTICVLNSDKQFFSEVNVYYN